MSRRTRPRKKGGPKIKLGEGQPKEKVALYSETEEDLRAEALSELGVLDTAPEERFDRICRLAQEVMKAPATYISFLDRDRQWFKSTCGMGEVRETPRDGTFCDYAVRRSRPTVVLNANDDPFFAKSPYVADGPQVKFYAGFPLMYGNQRVGTLCALDFEPREEVTDQQMEQFYDLARIAEREIGSSSWGQDSSVPRRLPVTILKSRPGEVELLESLEPEIVVAVLNIYIEHMLAAIARWDGSLDSLTGGSLRVVFHGPEQEARAAACALEMQLSVPDVNLVLEERGLPLLAPAIGIHTDQLVIGFLEAGGLSRSTLVGAGLAQADELASHAEFGQVLLSRPVAEALGELATTSPFQNSFELTGLGELKLDGNS